MQNHVQHNVDDNANVITRVKQLHSALLAALYNRELLGERVYKVIEQAEKKTKVSRNYMAYGLIGIVALYMIVGRAAELLCNVAGFAYPAFASFRAIRTDTKKDDTQWLTYWCVFGALSVADFFSRPIMSVFPLYWLVKTLFLVWLYAPQTRGAEQVYKKTVEPIMLVIEMRFARNEKSE